MNRLQVLHQENLEKEEILNKELERAKVQTQAEIERSKEDAKAIVETAKRNAEQMVREAAEQAQFQSKKVLAESNDRAKRLENEALAGAERKAIQLAGILIKYTFAQGEQKILHQHLMDELIDELRKVEPSRIAVQTDHAEILTSINLDQKEKETLKEILSSKLGHEISIKEQMDPSLIFGIIIRLGGLVIDGSLKNKLTRAVSALDSQSA